MRWGELLAAGEGGGGVFREWGRLGDSRLCQGIGMESSLDQVAIGVQGHCVPAPS